MASKVKSKRPGLQGQALKEFRSSVSKLKSKGLVRKTVDARSQKPTRYMRTKVRNLADVLEGKVSPVKRSYKVAQEYKHAGFRVVNNRLILPTDQAKRVRNSHNEWLTLEKMTNGGTIERRVILPVGVRNIESFLADEKRIDALIHGNRRLAFTYYGNKSLQTFPTASSIFEWLQHYSVVQGKNKEQEQAWDNMVLFDLREDRAKDWEQEAYAQSAAHAIARRRKKPRRMLANGRNDIPNRYVPKSYAYVKERERLRKQAERANQSEEVKKTLREINRDRMRNYRAKLRDKG